MFFHKKESEVDQRLFFLLSELGVASTLSRVRIQHCYHSTIEVAPYRHYTGGSPYSHYTTYGRKCRSPVGEKKLLGPDLVQEADEKVEMIRKRLLTTQSRQKCYAEGRDLEKKRKEITSSFQVFRPAVL